MAKPEPSPRVPKLRCPVIACHLGPTANIYTGRIIGPDGRQRAFWGCWKHLELQCGKALSGIRLEPFE